MTNYKLDFMMLVFHLFMILVMILGIFICIHRAIYQIKMNDLCSSNIKGSYFIRVDETHYNCCVEEIINQGNGYKKIEKCEGFILE